ncbi:MAG: hypothetical protein ACYC2T_01000 [Bacillota bacterium]
MKLKGWHLPLVVIFTLLALTLLLGGQRLYVKNYKEQPLLRKMAAVDTVKQVKMAQNSQGTTFMVQLGPVPNLQKTYLALLEATKGESQPVELVIEDQPSPKLEKVWYNSQFAVYQAVAQGDFTEMFHAVEKESLDAGLVKFQLYVDGQRVYLQLEDQGKYLYKVIPRNMTQPGGGEKI